LILALGEFGQGNSVNKHIRCAIAGLGRIGSTLEDDMLREKPASHAGAIAAHPECVIAAGADTNPEKREDFRRRWSCGAVFADYREMLSEIRPDIFHIAAPAEMHREMLLHAIGIGIPVILCEKPLAPTLDDAQAMLEYAEKGVSKIIVNHERRYALDYAEARRKALSGAYGGIVSITAKVLMGKKRKARDVLLDDATHMIDIIRYITGRELIIECVVGDPESTIAPLACLLRAGSIAVFLEAGPGRDHIVFEADISMRRGRIVIGNGYYQEYESAKSPFYEHLRSLRPLEASFPRTEYFSRMFAEAVSLFKNERAEATSSIKDGYEAIKTIDGILKKSHEGSHSTL
jgi:predicted dehydrogenase